MPIIDFEKQFEQAKIRFFANSKISNANKNAMKEVLKVYTKRPATKGILVARMSEFLEHFKDIKKDMHDYDKIISVLAKLSNSGTFETYRNKSNIFVKILNKNIAPEPFIRAWKSYKRKKGGRVIRADKHLTWDDALDLISHTNSTQLKAVLMTQLDAGMRPSEFVDLNYGDVKQEGRFMIIRIPKERTKTGEARDIECWRCSPYLSLWLKQHPTKGDDDPLWIQENQTNGEYKRYKYGGLKRRLTAMNTKVWDYVKSEKGRYKVPGKIRYDKPLDFYALRHSSCFLDKAENIPLDIASGRHGHDVKFFVNVYGKEDSNARMKRIDEHQGVEDEKERKKKEARQNIVCPVCDLVNESGGNELCVKCGTPLTMKKALEAKREKSEKLNIMEKQMEEMNKKLEIVDKYMALQKS